ASKPLLTASSPTNPAPKRRRKSVLAFSIAVLAMAATLGIWRSMYVPAPILNAADKDSDAKPETPAAEESPFRQVTKVPQNVFSGGKEWLNASGPITPRDLKGKIVIVDFWTYCCINCMHVLPELKAIEKKYPSEVVVIGVHSAKFENEKETGNIRRAV